MTKMSKDNAAKQEYNIKPLLLIGRELQQESEHQLCSQTAMMHGFVHPLSFGSNLTILNPFFQSML